MALERVRVHRLACDTCKARTITVPTMEELRALAKGIHWHATEYVDGGVFALCVGCRESADEREGWHRQAPTTRACRSPVEAPRGGAVVSGANPSQTLGGVATLAFLADAAATAWRVPLSEVCVRIDADGVRGEVLGPGDLRAPFSVATEADLAAERAERAERASSRALIESIVTHCDHYGERAVVSSIALALSEVADRNASGDGDTVRLLAGVMLQASMEMGGSTL